MAGGGGDGEGKRHGELIFLVWRFLVVLLGEVVLVFIFFQYFFGIVQVLLWFPDIVTGQVPFPFNQI